MEEIDMEEIDGEELLRLIDWLKSQDFSDDKIIECIQSVCK
jgi:hypothetical protein